jgi:hypothetical protein
MGGNAAHSKANAKSENPLHILDVDNLSVSIKAESLLLDRCLDRVLGVEDLVEFLKGAVLSLWDQEVDND